MHRALSSRLLRWRVVALLPASAHQRNLCHAAVIFPCQILLSEILAVSHNFKSGLSVPEGSVWFQWASSCSKLPTRQLCVCKSSRRPRRGRHLTQVPQARGPHRTLSDAFPVNVQERSRLFHAVLRKGLPVSAGLSKSPHIRGQGGMYMQCDRATKRSGTSVTKRSSVDLALQLCFCFLCY